MSAPSCDASIDAAETEYRIGRAEIELKFREDLESWQNKIDRLGYWSRLGQLKQPGLGSVDELSINIDFQRAAFAYVEAEMENFAALLLNRRTLGDAGVKAIREHNDELIETVREYHWRPLLDGFGLSAEDIEAAWVSLSFGPLLTPAYEEILWKAEIDFDAAVALWVEWKDSPFGPTVLEASEAETERNIVARNLNCLRKKCGLSYRALSDKAGVDDHKATRLHCAGARLPGDLMLGKYTYVFNAFLKEEITPEQLRTFTEEQVRTLDVITSPGRTPTSAPKRP
ncbi:MAG: hypothetical protein ABSB88_11860 [Bryobacteraceae bacterium]|jgi:hypothetical protein